MTNSTIQYDSMRIPYSLVLPRNRIMRGQQIVLIPLEADGATLDPMYLVSGGFRNLRISEYNGSKYMPHQGAQECARRRSQAS